MHCYFVRKELSYCHELLLVCFPFSSLNIHFALSHTKIWPHRPSYSRKTVSKKKTGFRQKFQALTPSWRCAFSLANPIAMSLASLSSSNSNLRSTDAGKILKLKKKFFLCVAVCFSSFLKFSHFWAPWFFLLYSPISAPDSRGTSVTPSILRL